MPKTQRSIESYFSTQESSTKKRKIEENKDDEDKTEKTTKTSSTTVEQSNEPPKTDNVITDTKDSSKEASSSVATTKDSITYENMEELIDPNSSWYKILSPEFSKPYWKKLKNFLKEEKRKETEDKGSPLYPPVNETFSAFNYCDFDNVKVVIIGQDPYHGPRQAHGLCFSVKKPEVPPPSLKNIFKELQSDLGKDQFCNGKIPSHGQLSKWAKQGVLLLNAVLTVSEKNPNSHQNQGWETFTDHVISSLNKSKSNVVYLLWGKPAQKKAKIVDKKKNLVLESAHPSPLSCKKFFGCKHFSKCNEYLKKVGKDEIDWNLD